MLLQLIQTQHLTLAKEVVTNNNPGWMNNYSSYPITKVAPVLAILGAIIAFFTASKAKAGLSFAGTSLMIVGAILTAGFALFPFYCHRVLIQTLA